MARHDISLLRQKHKCRNICMFSRKDFLVHSCVSTYGVYVLSVPCKLIRKGNLDELYYEKKTKIIATWVLIFEAS